jgi:hypothetical protein
MRVECRLRVFEDGVLRTISGPKRNEVTGEWRQIRNEVLNDLYSSPNIINDQIEKNYMSWNVACMGDRKVAYRVLVGKSEGKRPPGKTRRRWRDTIKMDLQKVRGGIDWI